MKLRPYQERMRALAAEQDMLIAAPPGLGKTAAMLFAIHDQVFDQCTATKVLWCAPKIVVSDTVPLEIEKWGIDLPYKVWTAEEMGLYVREDGKLRVRDPEGLTARVLSDPAVLHLVSHDHYYRLVLTLGAAWPFDWVCLDESWAFSDMDSGRFKAHQAVQHHCKPRTVMLNGTPVANGLQKLWGQLLLIDGGEALGKTLTQFQMQYMEPDRMNPREGRVYSWKARPGAVDAIVERCRGKIMTLLEADWLDLPDFVPVTHYVDIPRAEYDEMERECLLELENDREALAVNAGILYNKLSQIACLAGDTEVLTARGWVALVDVSLSDFIWDGVEWVAHQGLTYKGVRPVITRAGASMTPDHLVLTTAGWKPAQEVKDGNDGEGFDRADVRLPDGVGPSGLFDHQDQGSTLALPLRVRHRGGAEESKPPGARPLSSLRMSAQEHETRENRTSTIQCVEQHETPVRQHLRQGLGELWRARDTCLRTLDRVIREFLGGHARFVSKRADAGSDRQRRPIFTRELPVGDREATEQQPAELAYSGHTERSNDGGTGGRRVRADERSTTPPTVHIQLASGKSVINAVASVAVYDLINCGPRNRFVVRGRGGVPLIVHNCGIAFDTEADWHEIHRVKIDKLLEIREAHPGPLLIWTSFQPDIERICAAIPGAKQANKVKNLERDWNAGKIDTLVAHPASLAAGANLQDAPGSAMCWFGVTGNALHWSQAIKRLHRSGRREPVLCYSIVARNTVEEGMLQRRLERGAVEGDVMSALAWRG